MTRAKKTGRVPQTCGMDSLPSARWELVYEIAKHLQGSWEVQVAVPQEVGYSVGIVTGPLGMRLFFKGAHEKFPDWLKDEVIKRAGG